METKGRHVVADVWLNEFFQDNHDLCAHVQEALAHARCTVEDYLIKEFGPKAMTGLWLLSESHFSIHTFPERNFISVDCYTCGDTADPMLAVAEFISMLDVKKSSIKQFERGTEA